MFWMIFAVVLVFIVAAAVAAKGGRNGHGGYPYAAEKPLFTPAERSFLGVIDQALGNRYRIFGKVRVADVLSVKKGGGRAAFSRISAKHFDFVLCNADDLRPVCAIELNDQSHQQKRRQGRDEFLTAACKAAGLPLVWITAQHVYSTSSVLAAINEALPEVAATLPTVLPQPTSQMPPSTGASGTDASFPSATSPSCPKCANPMVKRAVKTGAKQGAEFWGCSQFPSCRGIIPI